MSDKKVPVRRGGLAYQSSRAEIWVQGSMLHQFIGYASGDGAFKHITRVGCWIFVKAKAVMQSGGVEFRVPATYTGEIPDWCEWVDVMIDEEVEIADFAKLPKPNADAVFSTTAPMEYCKPDPAITGVQPAEPNEICTICGKEIALGYFCKYRSGDAEVFGQGNLRQVQRTQELLEQDLPGVRRNPVLGQHGGSCLVSSSSDSRSS